MVAAIRGPGPVEWEGSRDAEGHREYTVSYLVECDNRFDGPATALEAPGLPVPGSFYILGNDSDIAAFCRQDVDITLETSPRGS